VDRFGEQLLQVFGDLARREWNRGGLLSLIQLWMRTVPDVVATALRQHLAGLLKARSEIRTRWVLASGFGSWIGTVCSLSLTWMGWSPIWLNTLCVALGLAFFQFAWALRRRSSEVIRWMIATSIGMFLLARPFRTAVGFPGPWWAQLTGTFLTGLGVGLLQSLVLRKATSRPWRWIAAIVIANFAGMVGAAVVVLLLYPVLSFISREFAANLVPLAMSVGFGVVFGCVTSIPIRFNAWIYDSIEPGESDTFGEGARLKSAVRRDRAE
jgi:hypothetical protein